MLHLSNFEIQMNLSLAIIYFIGFLNILSSHLFQEKSFNVVTYQLYLFGYFIMITLVEHKEGDMVIGKWLFNI